MAATDARPVVRKGEAARVYFFVNDENGDIVDGPTGLAAVLSKDAAGESATTNSPANATFTKRSYIDFTAAETNANHMGIEVTSNEGEPTQIDIYPESQGDYRIDPTTVRDSILSDSTAFAGANIDAAISSRSSHSAAAVWAVGTRTLTAGTKDSEIDAIKAKTDQLIFSVANVVDSNIQYVNDVQVDGVGSDADPWGPV